MNLLLLLAVGGAAYFIWSRSVPLRAGGWRVGAGLAALVMIVLGAVLAIKGEPWLGLPLAAAGLATVMSGRIGRGARPAKAEAMTVAEARSILGLNEGATAQEIKAAYLRLMKRNHPDQGGTTGLAAKLNAARERLLRER